MFKDDLLFLIVYPFIESFNGSLRDECLNTNLFLSIENAQNKLEAWRVDYNEYRPHSSLDNMTPAEFVGQLSIRANIWGEIVIEGKVKTIGVNKNHSETRQRFTIAHELGHYINGHTYFDKTGSMYKDEGFDYANPIHQQEKEANSFAAELLVPKDFIKKDLDKIGLDMPALTKLYKVSEQMMWIRLTSLRLAEKYSR